MTASGTASVIHHTAISEAIAAVIRAGCTRSAGRTKCTRMASRTPAASPMRLRLITRGSSAWARIPGAIEWSVPVDDVVMVDSLSRAGKLFLVHLSV
ncbi:hypothetical protein IWX65_001845 [Arthrobacter sp. CAN_A214]